MSPLVVTDTVLKVDDDRPKYSTYSCVQSTLNNLTIWCDPSRLVAANESLSDVYAQGNMEAPTGLQISMGLDDEGIAVEHTASTSGNTIKFSDLEPGNDYYVFLAAVSDTEYQPYGTMIKGTTHPIYVQVGWVINIMMIYLLV